MGRKGWSRSAAKPTIMPPILSNNRAATHLLAAFRPSKNILHFQSLLSNAYPFRVAIRGLKADPEKPLSPRAWRYRNDPIYREQKKAKARTAYRENVEYRERKLAQRFLRYHTDDDHRLLRLNSFREWYHRMSSDPDWVKQYNARPIIRNMACRQASSDLDIEWASHTPVHHEEKTEVFCSGCQRPKRLKLFWMRNAEPEKLDCHACFTSDPDRRRPIGYVQGRRCSKARDETPVADNAHAAAAQSSAGPHNVPRQTITINVPSSHRHSSTPRSLASRRPDVSVSAEGPAKRDAMHAYVRKHRNENKELGRENYLRYYLTHRKRVIARKQEYNSAQRLSGSEIFHRWEQVRRRHMTENIGYLESQRIYTLAKRSVKNKIHHWKTHTPVRHDKTEEIICASCKRPKTLVLWWARKDDPAELDCHSCFILDEAHKWPIGYYTAALREAIRVRAYKCYHGSPKYRHRIQIRQIVERMYKKPDATRYEWVSHKPDLSTEKVKRICRSCKRERNIKLWWRVKDAPQEEYDCQACFIADTEDKWPMGYAEDKRSRRDPGDSIRG